ncbi:MAG: transcription termination factor Rho [Planctomyces sp.]|nr:transcription termination factor Rho [Planctomyces sp.]
MATNRPRSPRSSSSSSGSSGSTRRTPARPKKKPVARDPDLDESLTAFDFEEAREQHGKDEAADDFGADIIEEAPRPKATRARKTTRSKTAAEPAEAAPAAPAKSRSAGEDFGFDPEPAAARDADDDADEADDFDAPEQGSSSESGDDGPSGEGPRRRRRRRRKKNRGQPGEGEQNQQGQGQGMIRPQGHQRPRPQGGYAPRDDRYRGGPNRNQDYKKNRGPTAKFQRNAPPPEPAVTSGVIEGVLELHPKGYGFLRDQSNDYAARETDPFVSSSFVERHHLREGIMIRGEVGPGSRGQGPRLLTIESIDGRPVEEFEQLKHFDTLTPVNPHEQLVLETTGGPVTMRVMDLLTPIGKGQRALLVAPPRTGKTMLLQEIADAITKNHPEVHLIVLLIDERPEEVTDMRRRIKGEIIASSMDREIESHVRISQLIFERGKRLAEEGKDVVILMDSVTRTARAFNKWISQSGRARGVMSGGLDVKALDIPKKMFGTARRFEDGGSLTVIATALIETNSKMDEVIFQEFKGTGNMELVLSRDLADRRIWPAIDISKSGTRREEKILAPEVLDGVIMLRRSLVSMNPTEAMEQLIRTLAKFPTNKEFLQRIRNVL